MISQQIEDSLQQIEVRVATLEKELALLRQIQVPKQDKEPSWLKIVGSFENDPTFDEAVRLGQEWRRTAE